MAQGRDTRPVGPSREAKTVSAERTMDYDVPASQLVPVLDTVLDAAHHRLAESGAAARTVTVRLRNAQFTTIGRSVSLPQACTDLGELHSAALTALRAATEAMGLDTEEESGAGARLLGVALGALSNSTQLTLLPGETAQQSPTDPAALPLPHRTTNRPHWGIVGMTGCPAATCSTPSWDADGLCGQCRHRTHPPERTSCTCASRPPTPDLRANAASRSTTPT